MRHERHELDGSKARSVLKGSPDGNTLVVVLYFAVMQITASS